MVLGNCSRPSTRLKGLHGVRIGHYVDTAEEDASSAAIQEGRINSRNVESLQSRAILEQAQPAGKPFWPCWLRPLTRHKHGDHCFLETVANVVTSVPFIFVGLQTPRKRLVSKLYADSLVGVGVASTLYHASRGEVRKVLRRGDYTMIATSAVCLSRALLQEQHWQALFLGSALLIPFQPFLVTILHTGLTEATFARRSITKPHLRRAHNLHTISSLAGGTLFVADDMFPNTPYLHAAWHLAAALSVLTYNKLLE